MTDKELLELAAQAAGIDGAYYSVWHDSVVSPTDESVLWNPLTDDGDALRLAVKLGFNVSCDLHEDKETTVIFHRGKWEIEKHGKDPCAATRRAIVRAAAEIGRTK